MAIKDAVATVLTRNSFYRDGYRLLLRLSFIQIAVIALLVFSIIGLVTTSKTQQIYFATTSDGRIIPLVPLDQPYQSQAQVVTWAAKTAQNVMRFGYFDYQTRLQEAEGSFTASGYANFNKALKDSGILDALSSRKLTVTLSVNAAPEITDAFVDRGVYTWKVRFPVTIKFDGVDPPQPINADLRMQIIRVSTLLVPEGIGIEQWLVVTAGTGQ